MGQENGGGRGAKEGSWSTRAPAPSLRPHLLRRQVHLPRPVRVAVQAQILAVGVGELVEAVLAEREEERGGVSGVGVGRPPGVLTPRDAQRRPVATLRNV